MNFLAAALVAAVLAGAPAFYTEYHGRVMSHVGKVDLDLSKDELVLVPLPPGLEKAGWECAVTPIMNTPEMHGRSLLCRNGATMVGATALCYRTHQDVDVQRLSLTVGEEVVALELACTTKPLGMIEEL